MKHTKTDPACSEYRGHRTPRNPLTRYLDQRVRGKSCRVCFPLPTIDMYGEYPWAIGAETEVRSVPDE